MVEANPYGMQEEPNPYASGNPTEPPPTYPAAPPPAEDEPAGTATTAPDVEPGEPEATAGPDQDGEDEDERVKLHAIGLGWHATMFATESTDGYTLQGPELAYTYFVGRRWGFTIRGAIYFPTYGRMAGPEADIRINLTDSYQVSRIGIDGLFGAARRFELGESTNLSVGMGAHVQSFRINSAQYFAVEAITGGLGGYARLDWRFSRLFSLGVDLSAAVDFLDFVAHENRATVLVPFAGGVSLGVTY